MKTASIQLEIDDANVVGLDPAGLAAFKAQCEALADEVRRRGLEMVSSYDPSRQQNIVTIYGPAKELLQIEELHKKRGHG